MASWAEVEAEAPELAARAKDLLEGHTHLTIATVRRDGSPRISGTEIIFRDDDLRIGSMWKSVKALDLRRDPRYALHSGSADPADWPGDAKVAGRAEETTELGGEGEPSHSFRLDVSELVVVHLNEERTKLVIESWHEGRGLDRLER